MLCAPVGMKWLTPKNELLYFAHQNAVLVNKRGRRVVKALRPLSVCRMFFYKLKTIP